MVLSYDTAQRISISTYKSITRYIVFECVQRKMLSFQMNRVHIYVDIIDHFSLMHEVLMRQVNAPFVHKVAGSY